MEPDPIENQTAPSPTTEPDISVEQVEASPSVVEAAPPVAIDTPEVVVPPPNQITPELETLFQSWLKTYQRKISVLGTVARGMRKQKKKMHILELIGKHGSMTRREVVNAVHISPAQIERYLRELSAESKICHVGNPHEGRYKLQNP